MKKILIHLGYPKTGSTSIQYFLSKINHKDFTFFNSEFNKNPYCSIQKKKYSDIEKEIFFENTDKFKDNWIKYFETKLNKLNVISNEHFLNPIGYRMISFERSLKRYLDIFNHLNCKIELLIIIRDPKKLHISFFTDMYHRFLQYDKSLNSFEKYILSFPANQTALHIFEMFNFNKIVNQIQEIDQKFIINKNFKILKLENINDFKEYFLNFCDIIDLKNFCENLDISKKHVTKKNNLIYIRNYDFSCFFAKNDPKNKFNFAIKKKLKHSRALNFILNFYKIRSTLTKGLSEKIDKYYYEDLIELEKKTNLNLKIYYQNIA